MTYANDSKTLSSQLLAQDRSLSEGDYEKYRTNLTRRIESARRTEQIAYWICAVSGVVSLCLMFVGGSKILGDFDPWSKDATAVSLTVAAVYLVSTIVFCVLLASYYSRFRPRTRQAQEQFREIQWLQLEARLEALQKDVALLMNERRRNEPIRESEKSPPTE
jgi:hypothetical protein